MEQFTKQLDKGQLAFVPQLDQHQFAAQLLSPMQRLECISSESLKGMAQAFGNVLNDLKTEYEARKSRGDGEDRRCGG